MTPDPLREDARPDDGESDATKRIHPGVDEPIETTKSEPPKGLMTSLREAYERARDGRRHQPKEKQPRTAQTVDRSKGLPSPLVRRELFSSPATTILAIPPLRAGLADCTPCQAEPPDSDSKPIAIDVGSVQRRLI
jgi:hypothetical protein